jgi:hypothetical protein
MALNIDGAGGVAPGTFYTVGETIESVRVARYNPEGDFEMRAAR